MTIDATLSWPPEPDVARRVAADVEHLLAPNASSWTYEGTNSWVIARGGSSLLVDPGIENDAHLEALRRTGTSEGREVAGVLLTHDHPDHSDGARRLAESLDVPILAMSDRFADDRLEEGRVLALGDLELTVLHTPGHSDDSICLWMPGTGILLTGDTLLGARSAGVMGRLAQLLASLERLQNLATDRELLALPGHGPMFTDPVESAARIIEVRTRRIDQVRGFIADGDTTLMALIHRLYPHLHGSRAMFAASTVISTVDYLTELDGEHGIGDAAQRERIIADVTEYKRMMAERSHESR